MLHPPESCTLDDLDPASYGVIVTSGYRRGLLLPDLEGVDDVAATGLDRDAEGRHPAERPVRPASDSRSTATLSA